MAWTNLTFSFGQVLTSTQMTQLDDNFEALATGASGAPELQSASYAAGSVDTTALKNLNVTTAKIADSNVTFAKLASDAKGQITHTQSTTPQLATTSYVDYITRSITTQGGPVLVLFTGVMDMDNYELAAGYIYLQLYRDSTLIGIEHAYHCTDDDDFVAASISDRDDPSAGTYTYRLKIKYTNGLVTMDRGSLVLAEAR